MNYEKDVKIDENALDIEWLDQPSLMLKYAKHAAIMSRALDDAKEELDAVSAELDKLIRADPDKFDLPKVTEGAITSAIKLDKRHKTAYSAMLDAKYESDMAKGAVRALESKKDALENLVKLHGQQYFAGPKMPRDISWEREQKQNRADQTVGQRLKRNNKIKL